MSGDSEDRVAGMAAALDGLDLGRLSGTDQRTDQPDLLGRDEVGAGPMDEPLSRLGTAMFGTPRRGGGRPAGAKNRSTEAWRGFFLSQRRDPALVLGDLYSMPVEEMAARLGCDRLDAIKVQLRAAEILMPYLHQKQPLAIKSADDSLPVLHLVVPAQGGAKRHAGGEDEAGEVLDLFASNVEENQRLSLPVQPTVGKGELVGAGKAKPDQGVTRDASGISNLAQQAAQAVASAEIACDTSGEARPERMRHGGTPPNDAAAESPPPVTELDEV